MHEPTTGEPTTAESTDAPERTPHDTDSDPARTSSHDTSEPTPRTLVGRDPTTSGQTLHLGAYRARDGATGAPLHLDTDHPHAISVVGKRGSGKSHTLGVLAEGLATTDGVTPVLLDTMGEFAAIAHATDGTTPDPRIRADDLPARAWCDLLDLHPTSATGSLVWRASTETTTLDAMIASVGDAETDRATRRAASNHLALARNWDVFHPDADPITTHLADGPTVIDCSTLPDPATNAVCHAIATGCYTARTTHDVPTLPWLLLDEAHVCFDGTARTALETLLTRGRSPGVSIVAATQRPTALPDVALSQSDLTIAHTLTNGHDRDALTHAHPTRDVATALPDRTGDALVVDDATDTTHHVHVRHRHTHHGGTTPIATEVSNDHLSHRDH